MKSQKILFLDIDGVLNSKIYYKYIYKPEEGHGRFDPYCVVLIRRLIEEFSLQVVITSTWRNGVVERLMKELEESNLMQYLHSDWHTPILRSVNRGKEIQLWLDNHPETEDYIIIDDNENLLEYQLNKFVKTDNYAGMAQMQYHQARNLLLTESEFASVPLLLVKDK